MHAKKKKLLKFPSEFSVHLRPQNTRREGSAIAFDINKTVRQKDIKPISNLLNKWKGGNHRGTRLNLAGF